MKSIVLAVALAALGRQQMHGAHDCEELKDLIISVCLGALEVNRDHRTLQ